MTSIDHVDLNLLRVFQAIVDERSLTKAGERLALSQPAISYSLARLRTLFDDPLFIRTRSGMQPTPIALELASIVGRALDTVREALRYAESFDPATSTRTFRLSLSDAGEMAYLPAICEALHERAPRVKLSVEPLPVEEIEDALRSSRLDFAIGNLPMLMARTRHQLLFEETYVCMTRKRRGLPAGSALSLEHFLQASHVQVRSVEHSHHALDDALRAQGVGRNIVLQLPHFVALPGVLAVTDLFATLPQRLAGILNGNDAFRIYTLPVSIPQATVTMHWHEHFHEDEGIAWMRDLMAEMVKRFDKT
ncbi:LysR family transcriptional regulator [Paraburkholderia hospita]|jgi:DNA-binding transcriptional LysR family regulator|uniref:LysR family transcriptional regulator n=1 Tax=Paraburkholderia hospita TaxID=169430 RepID=UPI0002715084|nr:LysR family transcriptional regulator [Paraburkholderia hospita]EUC18000.1 transcriptional regulator, LysR family [Burkholderia sp. BT03]SOE46433.1 transcriptional regulator, LysR family [Burkholderia sp. YR290]AXE98309.1 LysR family transcriptional regulator [Paraburkholderia hospita]OUL78606.1 LysR family transcriptional regulator [Paraburkholderia hospita]SKC73177.1 transcriptional regulator, LysR family [Paraburkholderia hospita]